MTVQLKLGSKKCLWFVADKVPSAGTSHLFSFVCFFLPVCVSKFSKNMSFIFEGHNGGAEIVQQ